MQHVRSRFYVILALGIATALSVILCVVLTRSLQRANNELGELRLWKVYVMEVTASIERDGSFTLYAVRDPNSVLEVIAHHSDVKSAAFETTFLDKRSIEILSSMPNLEKLGFVETGWIEDNLKSLKKLKQLKRIQIVDSVPAAILARWKETLPGIDWDVSITP